MDKLSALVAESWFFPIKRCLCIVSSISLLFSGCNNSKMVAMQGAERRDDTMSELVGTRGDAVAHSASQEGALMRELGSTDDMENSFSAVLDHADDVVSNCPGTGERPSFSVGGELAGFVLEAFLDAFQDLPESTRPRNVPSEGTSSQPTREVVAAKKIQKSFRRHSLDSAS